MLFAPTDIEPLHNSFLLSIFCLVVQTFLNFFHFEMNAWFPHDFCLLRRLPTPPCGAGLRFLDVSDNRFGDDAAKALARALHDDDTLKGLDLARNAVGQRGVCLGPLILPYPTPQWRRLVALKKAPLSHGGAGVYDCILLGICHEREFKITTFI